MPHLRRRAAFTGLAVLAIAAPLRHAAAQKGVAPSAIVVGGKPMISDHDLLDNISQSADHTVLLDLLRLAGLGPTLAGKGPYTVFAPTNAAFAALPDGMLARLRRPEDKSGLVALLSTQILPDNYSAARLNLLLRRAKGGTVELPTLNDGKVVVGTNGPLNLTVRDPKGNVANVALYDAKASNGVLFVTDRVLLPG